MALVSKTFSQIITFTRASTATYFDATGTLQSAAIDAPRFDYDPSTLAAQGFLIEEARTNGIRNNTMVGAVAGTPGTAPTNWSTFTTLTGLTRTVVGTGTENGITYVDIRVNGTPSAAGIYGIYFEGSAQVAAANGQNWTSSSYIKLAGGSLTGISTVNYVLAEISGAGGFLASSATVATPTGSALSTQRTVISRAFNQATTAFALPYLDLGLSGAAIDITLRIGLPQLEQGAFATSVIPTTTTALTRSADVASVNTLSPWFNSVAGTIVADVTVLAVAPATALQSVFAISDGTADNRISVYKRASADVSIRFDVAVATVSSCFINAGTFTTTNRIASAYETNNFAAALNGGAAVTDTVGAVPTVTQMSIGAYVGSTFFLNGHFRRITYYPRRLSNAELQAITA